MGKSQKTKKIVVRLKPNHPSGSRNRAGFTFTSRPSSVEVTKEQLEMIENDKHLIIVKGGTALKQATPAKKAGETAENSDENDSTDDPGDDVDDSEGEEDEEGDDDSENDESEEDSDEDETDPSAELQKLSIPKIILKLEEAGMVAGEDFDKRAKKDDLIELLLAQ